MSVNDGDGTIIVDPSQPSSEGDYTYVLQSCIYVQNQPLSDPSDVTQICSQPSTGSTISVQDPCITTEIITSIFLPSHGSASAAH